MFDIGSENVLRRIVKIAAEDVELREAMASGEKPLDNKDVRALCEWSSAMVSIEQLRKKRPGPEDMTDAELRAAALKLKDDPMMKDVGTDE